MSLEQGLGGSSGKLGFVNICVRGDVGSYDSDTKPHAVTVARFLQCQENLTVRNQQTLTNKNAVGGQSVGILNGGDRHAIASR